MKIIKFLIAAVAVLLMISANIAMAQQGGGTGSGGTGGGGTGGGGTGGTGGFGTGGTTGGFTGLPTGGSTTGQTGGTGGASQGTGGTGGTNSGSGDIQGLNIAQSTYEFQDISNQPFVGATSAFFSENGFTGATSLSLGGSDAAIFGGGLNSGTGTSGGGGARTTGGAVRGGGTGGLGNQGFGGGAFGGGSGLVNLVSRSAGVRAALQNQISITRPANAEVAGRITNRLDQIPAVRSEGNANITVSVDNGTATVSGTPATLDQADRIIRMLKLEPGVYRVENKMTAPAKN